MTMGVGTRFALLTLPQAVKVQIPDHLDLDDTSACLEHVWEHQRQCMQDNVSFSILSSEEDMECCFSSSSSNNKMGDVRDIPDVAITTQNDDTSNLSCSGICTANGDHAEHAAVAAKNIDVCLQGNNSFRQLDTDKDCAVENKVNSLYNKKCDNSDINTITSSNYNDQTTKNISLPQKLALLDKIAQVQRQYFQSEKAPVVFGNLLQGLLELMQSEYGFIGSIKYTKDKEKRMYLQTHAITNIAWDQATRQFYYQNVHNGLEFHNLDSLFGHVMVSKKAVIANDPSNHPKSCGIPVGHPPLDYFLGIPFFRNQDGELIGMVGIANKPGGYTEEDVAFLEPFVVTCSNLIQAYAQVRCNEELVESLEEKVRLRTLDLQTANHQLEQANQRVIQASKAQLQHFACMSHEIRTPLNCVIGLSSLLQDSQPLTGMQKDCLHLIVSSGELLLTVVNDVLDYAKLESGNVDIDIQRRSLQETLQSMVQTIVYKAQSKKVVLRTDYDVRLPEFVSTDNRRLQQILYNLLGNAMKFSKDEGVVELHVSLVKRSSKPTGYVLPRTQAKRKLLDEIECSLQCTVDNDCSNSSCSTDPADNASDEMDHGSDDRNGNRYTDDSLFLRFVVKDYGQGIHPNEFTRIFQPFLQSKIETQQIFSGTGLGLAITSRLVEGLGGRIAVESKLKEYAQFTVDLPFVGDVVNVDQIAQNVKDISVLWVAGEPKSLEGQYLCTHVAHIFQQYQITYQRFETMSQTTQFAFKNNQSYFVLTNEDLYDAQQMQRLSTSSHNKCILVTYGPKYNATDSLHHFRTLNSVLPSVLANYFLQLLTEHTSGAERRVQRKNDIVPKRDLRILIAEDNRVNQKVLTRMLNRFGMKNIEVVENGLQAVEREAAEKFDVVLMDMQMPVMDGIDACQHITTRRCVDSHPIAKVVFVTAHVSAAFEQDCQKAGGCGFLPKPFNMTDIQNCFTELQRVLDEEERERVTRNSACWKEASSLQDSLNGSVSRIIDTDMDGLL